jgi:hypothetical protein
MDTLRSNMALLAIYGRSCCQGCIARSISRGEAVQGRRYLCNADDGVLQVTERLLGLLQLSAYTFPVLLQSVYVHHSCCMYAHLARQRDRSAMYVHQAIGEVMSIVLVESSVYPFRRRMRLARWMVGT